jgi:predicted benzoate:H+ symporter BenE
MISSAVEPRLRGTFMTLNSAVQSASMGLAALLAGLIIGRDAQGQLTGYWMAGLLGVVASIVAALSAVALAAVLSETTIVVGVIVASTLASWFQLEHGSRPVARH